jgi:hypothetical protein
MKDLSHLRNEETDVFFSFGSYTYNMYSRKMMKSQNDVILITRKDVRTILSYSVADCLAHTKKSSESIFLIIINFCFALSTRTGVFKLYIIKPSRHAYYLCLPA